MYGTPVYDLLHWGVELLSEVSITVTSLRARWRLKSPASRLFSQPFIQADQRKYQSSVSLTFVRGIHR